MTEYNVRLEFNLEPTEEAGGQLVAAFSAFHPAAGPSDSDNGLLDVWLTLDAKNARQAAELGLGLAAQHPEFELTAFEVITTVDFDRRQWLTPVPELVDSSTAAELLGITRQAVLQKAAAGELPSHRVGERTVVFARPDVEAIASRRKGK